MQKEKKQSKLPSRDKMLNEACKRQVLDEIIDPDEICSFPGNRGKKLQFIKTKRTVGVQLLPENKEYIRALFPSLSHEEFMSNKITRNSFTSNRINLVYEQMYMEINRETKRNAKLWSVCNKLMDDEKVCSKAVHLAGCSSEYLQILLNSRAQLLKVLEQRETILKRLENKNE